MSEWMVEGYPTEECEKKLESFGWEDASEINDGLDFLRDVWNTGYGTASHELRESEMDLVHMRGQDEKFLRLATGGWSGNEDLISAFSKSLSHFACWRLDAIGGLHIYRYMPW